MENKSGINPDCFFCHKKFDIDSPVNVFNLRQLFRYLKIKLKLDQNSVLLCTQCNTLGCQFNQQIVQLDVTRMMINYSLEQFISKIDTHSGGVVDVIQKLVKERCISQLRNVKRAQVKLKRLPRVSIVIPGPEDQFVSPLSSPPSPAVMPILSPEPEETIVKVEIDNEPNIRPTTKSNPKPKSKKKLKNSKPCDFCTHVMSNSQEYDYHQVENHPEKLLQIGKLDNTTDSQFLEICHDVLERHIAVKSNRRNNSNRFGCLCCQNLYERMKCLKHHTIRSHLLPLVEKVQELQQNVSRSLATEENTDKMFTCKYCSDIFANQIDLQIHKTNSCRALGDFGTIINENIENTVASIPKRNAKGFGTCKPNDSAQQNIVFDAKDSSNLNTLKETVKPQKIVTVQIDTSEPDDAVMSPVSVSVPFPPEPMSPPEDILAKSEDCNDELPSSSLFLESSKTSPIRKSDCFTPKPCRFCDKILNRNQRRDFHEVLLHPEKILLEGKLENTPDSIFLQICQDILARHKVVQNRRACLHCGNAYLQMRVLKLHNIKRHYPNTIEKVRQLQKIISSKNCANNLNNLKMCCYCDKKFSTKTDLRYHKMISCDTLGDPIVINSVSDTKVKKLVAGKPRSFGPRKRCKFCPKSFKSNQNLLLHYAIRHYLEYLNKAKLENVSDEEFEAYCQQLFEAHYSKEPGTIKRRCVYCKNSFPNFRCYKSHLMIKHADILYDKLREMQKEPPKLKVSLKNEGLKICKRICHQCGKWINSGHLSTHTKYMCKKGKNIFFKVCKCHKKIYSQADHNKHINVCPIVKLVQCDKCGAQIRSFNLKKHQQLICSGRTSIYKKGGNTPKNCRFCDTILHRNQQREYHEVIFHPDKKLLEAKLDKTSDSIFLKICQDFLARHNVVGNRHVCLYCENAYAQIKCLKRHTIQSHYSNAIKKLRQVQKIVAEKNYTTDYLQDEICCYCGNKFKNIAELRNHKIMLCDILREPTFIKYESKPEFNVATSSSE